MVMKQMAIRVVTGAEEMNFSRTLTKCDYCNWGCLEVSQITLRGIDVALHKLACICTFVCVLFPVHLTGKSKSKQSGQSVKIKIAVFDIFSQKTKDIVILVFWGGVLFLFFFTSEE